jgi:hypothetical protein
VPSGVRSRTGVVFHDSSDFVTWAWETVVGPDRVTVKLE